MTNPLLGPRRLQTGNQLLADIAVIAPRVPWDVFVREHFRWEQGQHVALIGPTGRGKTSALIEILQQRQYVAVLATKPRDKTMQYLISHGYDLYRKWENIPASRSPRRVIWPDATTIDSDEVQLRVFRDAYARIYREGGWTLVIDEGWWISEVLKLKKEMRMMWGQGRALGISHVVGTQRAAWIPTEMYDQSRWLLYWRENRRDELMKLAGFTSHDPALVRYIIANLEEFQVLCVNTLTGKMFRTRPPAPKFNTEGR